MSYEYLYSDNPPFLYDCHKIWKHPNGDFHTHNQLRELFSTPSTGFHSGDLYPWHSGQLNNRTSNQSANAKKRVMKMHRTVDIVPNVDRHSLSHKDLFHASSHRSSHSSSPLASGYSHILFFHIKRHYL